ncbi:MAG: hypothetical protein JW822_12130 [Spirochaetales bacterium]|nr:hypothetical protein [Spirochaetales bacterium]
MTLTVMVVSGLISCALPGRDGGVKTTCSWTWISGSDLRFQSGVYGTKGISAATNIPGSRERSISFKDSEGNFWLFGGQGYDNNGYVGYFNDLWKCEP